MYEFLTLKFYKIIDKKFLMDYKDEETTETQSGKENKVDGVQDNDERTVTNFIEIIEAIDNTEDKEILDNLSCDLLCCFKSKSHVQEIKSLITPEVVNSILKIIFLTERINCFPAISCLDHAIALCDESIPHIIQSSVFDKLDFLLIHACELNQMEKYNMYGTIIRIVRNCSQSESSISKYIISHPLFIHIIENFISLVNQELLDAENTYITDTLSWLLDCIIAFDTSALDLPTDFMSHVSDLIISVIENKVYFLFPKVKEYLSDSLGLPEYIFELMQKVYHAILEFVNSEIDDVTMDERPSGNEIYPLLASLSALFHYAYEKTALIGDFKYIIEFVANISKAIDYDALYYYASLHKGIMCEENSENANEAFYLLGIKTLFDNQISTDIDLGDLLDLCVCVHDCMIDGKTAFSAFLFSYLLIAPECILEVLFENNQIGDFLISLEGLSIKTFKLIIDVLNRFINVLGIKCFETEGYVYMMETAVPEFLDEADELELDWRVGTLLQSYD